MKARYLVASGIMATSIYAGVVTSGGAWDNLPCGATEETAHLCAPGEKARDGSIPNPLPTPAPTPVPPEIVPVTTTPVVTTPAPAVVVPPVVLGGKKNAVPSPVTCTWLRHVRAGLNRLYKYRCIKVRKVTPLPGPFSPPVTGSLN
jgi:hypothetical protein